MYKNKSLSLDIPILEHNIDRSINYYVETAFANDVLYSLDKISMIAYFSMFNISFIKQNIYEVKITFSIINIFILFEMKHQLNFIIKEV